MAAHRGGTGGSQLPGEWECTALGGKDMGIICCVSCAGCCQPPHTGLGDCWPGPADALYFLDRITEYPEVDGALWTTKSAPYLARMVILV